MKRLIALTALAAAALGTHSVAAQTFDPNAAMTKPAQTVIYENLNEAIRMGAGFGDRGATAHGTFGTFPANFITPNHGHSTAYHGVVIEGVMTNPFGDEDPAKAPRLAAGSYWYVPAGAPHATACVSDVPCRFYFHSAGPFDFQPVE